MSGLDSNGKGLPNHSGEQAGDDGIRDRASGNIVVTPQRSPSPNGGNGRNRLGRFVSGNPGGPGNPNAKKVATYKNAFRAAVTPERMQAIFGRLAAEAEAGNVQAAAILSAYGLGRPKEPIEPEVQEEPAHVRWQRMMKVVRQLVKLYVNDDQQVDLTVRCWLNPPEYYI